ncbi:hypothetical protein KHM83_14140 [Fusibacter paucivorans]|uniref:Uncharacterized protein n=1 Tax=Fusibacter paucivorans TaxID=76009 RepID=A0ABS5PTD7_9FIRM|nr:hypothetical protein [Fusibacter paucivorans]MBS7527821.1 hypothetical protein [Fusibacter paucivorans]
MENKGDMMLHHLHMRITQKCASGYLLEINNRLSDQTASLMFDPHEKHIIWGEHTELAVFLMANEDQFRRLLHNKKADSFFIDFELDFSLLDGKDIRAFNDKRNIVVSDHGDLYVIQESQNVQSLKSIRMAVIMNLWKPGAVVF